MSYIGKEPADSFISFAKQDFTTSATTSYTLDNAVANENELALFINFVRQEPTTAYTASGTTLTLTSATTSSDDMYCVYLGQAKQTVNAPDGSVGSSQVAASIITGQTALGATPADTDELLISDAGTLKRVDYSYLKQANTPAFKAYLSSSPSISNTTITTITLNAEIFDTDSAYDTSNGKFTVPSGEGGKYFINVAARLSNWNVTQQNLYVYVGSTAKLIHENGDHQGDNNSVQHSAILNLSAGDEVTMRFYQNGGNGATLRTGEENTFFSAYKLIGV